MRNESQALSCCDVAYFPTGCSIAWALEHPRSGVLEADKSNVTGVGYYMAPGQQ